MESLESRKLLTVTTLTVNSISDGSFEAPALRQSGRQMPIDAIHRPPAVALDVHGRPPA